MNANFDHPPDQVTSLLDTLPMQAAPSSTLLQSDILKFVEAGILVWRTDSDRIELHGRWHQFLGYELTTPIAMQAQDWLNLLHPEDTQLCIRAREDIATGLKEHSSYEARKWRLALV